ncbi:MAG TPA: biotin--[acetyl-CoA-carboxylase] ligase [Chitinispirillaceae bacterium]|nr:biotin--[acetyl-CoA-carboxylase] ligase [Chitinispirillaceae bacterium]
MEKEFKNIIVLSEIDSTNNYANHLISDKSVDNGTVVLAHYQNKGRGQRQNHWHSLPGQNLLASLILFPKFLPAPLQFYLSKIVSIAMIKWLQNNNIKATIKWPNDIYVEHKKIAGILIETSVMGSVLHSAVAGIGFNLNQQEFSDDLPNPVSVRQIKGIDTDILKTASELRLIIMDLFLQLQLGELVKIDSSYLKHLFRYKEWALYKKNDQVFEGCITGIGEFGHLQLTNREGKTESYAFKEIEFVL